MTAPKFQKITKKQTVRFGYTTKGGYGNTAIENKKENWSTFCKRLGEPRIGKKDGPYFLRGECKGLRANANMERLVLVIIDGDSSIDPETRKVTSGAPDPVRVHEVLTNLGITHLIVTSHSHQQIVDGKKKGNRYRIILPTAGYKKEELESCVGWVIEQLRKNELPINNVSENTALSQPWYFPAKPDKAAEFLYLGHDGNLLDIEKCVAEYVAEQIDLKVSGSRVKYKHKVKGNSLFDQVKNYLSIPEMLEKAGFPFVSESINPKGGFIFVYSPQAGNSDSTGGIIVFQNADGTERLYSHHDRKENFGGEKHSMDAVDVYCRLNGNSKPFRENEEAARELCQILQDERFEEYGTRIFPVRDKKGITIYDIKLTTDGTSKFLESSKGNLCDNLNQEKPIYSVVADGPGDWKLKADYKALKKYYYKALRLDSIDSIPEPVGCNHNIQRITKDNRFNKFPGFPCRAQKGDFWEVKLLHFYLKNIVCGGHGPSYDFMLKILAHLVQKPSEKLAYAILLRGRRGSGKTFIYILLEAIVGTSLAAKYGKGLEDMLHEFSAEKVGLLVEHYEDIGGSTAKEFRKSVGEMQAYITATLRMIAAKGKDKVKINVYARLFFDTNFNKSLPFAKDERRFFVLDTPGWLATNGWFFEMLDGAINKPHVINAFVYELTQTDISSFNPNNRPIDTPGFSTAMAWADDLPMMDKWFSNMLSRTDTHGIVEGVNGYKLDKEIKDLNSFDWNEGCENKNVPKKVFQQDYAVWSKRDSYKDLSRSEVTMLGNTITNYMGQLEACGQGNSRYKSIPAKADVVKTFEEENGVDLGTDKKAEVIDEAMKELKGLTEEEAVGIINELKRMWVHGINSTDITTFAEVRRDIPNAFKAQRLSENFELETGLQKELALMVYPELEDIIPASEPKGE